MSNIQKYLSYPQFKFQNFMPGCLALLIAALTWTTPAHAVITFTGITNASNYTITNGVLAIFAGTAGANTGACTDLNNTCDTCAGAGSTAGGPAICNSTQINADGYLNLTFSSDTQFGTPTFKIGSNPITATLSPTSTTAGNQSITARLRWADMCTLLSTPSARCQSDGSLSLVVTLGSDSSTINITVQYSMCQYVDETGSSNTLTTARSTSPIDRNFQNVCNGSSVKGSEGIYAFSMKAGDGKAYLKDPTIVEGFPTIVNSVTVKAVRVYYEPIAAGESCAAVSRVRNSSKYFETPLTSQSTTSTTPDDDRVMGLQNLQKYVFKLAVVDQANNVGYFTNDADCSDATGTPSDGGYGFHVATPDEVVGLLLDKQNCFIATAAYGSSFEPHVNTLRRFRDTFLTSNKLGREFVRKYYDYSPRLAKAIAKNEGARFVTRAILWPVLGLAEICLLLGPLWSTVLLSLTLMAGIFWAFRRRSRHQFSFWIALICTSALSIVSVTNSTARAITTKSYAPPSSDPIAEEETPPNEPPYTTEQEIETKSPQNQESGAGKPAVVAEPNPSQQAEPHRIEPSRATRPPENFSSTTKNAHRRPPIVPSESAKKHGLSRVTSKGEYVYKIPITDQNRAASLRLGMFSFPSLTNKVGISYSDVYGTDSRSMLFFDYEWQIFRKAGILGISVGSGFYTATGNGRFKNTPSTKAEEVYTFLLFPNTVSLVYRAKYYDKQPVVPYAMGGLGYFTYLETRDDGQSTKYGGSPTFHGGGGLAFMIDFLSPKSMHDLDEDYGVNHVYLTAEYKMIQSLGGALAFTSNLFTGGVTVEF